MNKPFRTLLWPLIASKLLFRKKSYLYSTGWMESIKRGYPCRGDGTEIPWMNYSIIDFLERRLDNNIRLFEFGSGYSTAFYARLVQSVTSVEYDADWFSFIKDKAPGRVTLIYKEKDVDGEYCRSVNEARQVYDVVIVDGRDRVNCVKQSLEALSESGVTILDDSERERYREALDYAKEKGFRILDFEGLKPTKYSAGRSSIFYRDNNCLGI